MWGFWALWKQEEWNNVVTIKQSLVTMPQDEDGALCSTLPWLWAPKTLCNSMCVLSPLLSPRAVPRCEFCTWNTFPPHVSPLSEILLQFSWGAEGLGAPGLCSRRVQGAFTAIPRWGLFRVERAFLWPLIGLQAGNWNLLVFLVKKTKQNNPNTKKKTSQKAWAKAKEALWSKISTDFHLQPFVQMDLRVAMGIWNGCTHKLTGGSSSEPGYFSSPFFCFPNILLGSYKANPKHLPKFRVASHVTSRKATETKPEQNIHPHPRTIFTAEPSHPVCLCEQESVLQKFIKIYNWPQNCSGYSPPGAQTSLSLYIKYTSPVKVALLRAQWWFLQWRGGLGTALGDSAVSPNPWGDSTEGSALPMLCLGVRFNQKCWVWGTKCFALHECPQTRSFSEWPGVTCPPGDAWKSAAKGFLQDIKWLQGSPLASD